MSKRKGGRGRGDKVGRHVEKGLNMFSLAPMYMYIDLYTYKCIKKVNMEYAICPQNMVFFRHLEAIFWENDPFLSLLPIGTFDQDN